MDLAVGAKRVFIAMEHATRDGKPRLVRECSLPVTAKGVVKLVITNLGLFEPAGDTMILREIAAGVTREQVAAQTGAKLTIPDPLPVVPVTRH